MKRCNVCTVLKDLDAFNKAAQNTGGLMHLCRGCERDYRNSYKGKLIGLYKTQRCNSKHRGHPLPQYSFEEFYAWAEQNQYALVYMDWKSSGYLRRKAPSVDRIDDSHPYTFENMQLTTWGFNDDKAHADFKSGKLFNKHTPVKQLTKSGELVQIFPSQLAAQRATGIPQGNIGVVARKTGRRKTAGGFKWEYVN